MVVVVFLVVVAAVVLTGLGRPSDTSLALFSDAYAVPITPESRPLVERYIQGSRRLRMTGVIVSSVVLTIVMQITGGPVNATFYLGVGYGLGAVIYELVRRPPGSGGAVLSRRRIDDYVDHRFLRLLYATVVVGVAVFALSFVFEHRPGQNPSIEIQSYRVIGLMSLFGLAVAWVAARRIVHAPQPVISPAIDATQHAIRTAALISLVGLALMAAGILAIGAVEIGRSTAPDLFGDVVSIVGVSLSFISSFLGFFLTIRSLPRFAPFWRRLPAIASAEAAT